MKIKVRKKMKLPQLIEWAWENDVKDESYFSENSMRGVSFDSDGKVSFHFPPFAPQNFRQSATFTVENGEEITEDTIIPQLVAIYDVSGRRGIIHHKQKSISDILNDYAVAFYMLNDDMTLTLIWKDGELV
ncbi:hypothetical protein [Staphylococcus delphini]|uniref:hypothetical protein n=1 Tax=Staphylococcus delphini TaxID=53344 RepID=UPI001CCDF784|nr:hypothetical protein [Staphylococcus delphini]MBZ8174771.1 hypothetical protein [Staphylococcus delphini]